MLNGLVGGAILTYADRVVAPHKDGGQLLQGSQAHRRTHVVRKYQEGTAVGAGQPRLHNTVEHVTHSVLAHPEVDNAPVRAIFLRV